MYSERRCTECRGTKDVTRFATYKDRQGNVRRRRICWDCRNEYATLHAEDLRAYRKKYNAANRSKKQLRDRALKDAARAFVDGVKARPCADCGKQWPPVAMDLDHVRGDKIMDVARMVGCSYRLELIKVEVEKCEVVCACCHRLRTAARDQNLSPNR